LQEIVASDAEKLVQLMHSGTKNRAVSSTLMNSATWRQTWMRCGFCHFFPQNTGDFSQPLQQQGGGKHGENLNPILSR